LASFQPHLLLSFLKQKGGTLLKPLHLRDHRVRRLIGRIRSVLLLIFYNLCQPWTMMI